MAITNTAPVDESVAVPASVKRAAELAESFYKKPEGEAPPAQETAPETPPETPPAPIQQEVPAVPQAAPLPVPSKEEIKDDSWASRYNSMKGRYDQSQRMVGELQEQITQIGDELMRTQQFVRQQKPQQEPPQQPVTLLTAEDEEKYGTDLIDFAARVARQAMAPQLSTIQQENQRLKQTLQKQQQGSVVQTLEQQIPNWREIKTNPRFKEWLRLRDIYSGQLRSQMLSAAVQAADAPRVVAFYKGFVTDEAATGHADPAMQGEQPIAPRTAAMPLESLAAPGKGRPASGTPNTPADKPVFTRAQISKFYDDSRRGYYDGRQDEYRRAEAMIQAAQREGRIR